MVRDTDSPTIDTPELESRSEGGDLALAREAVSWRTASASR